MQVINDICKNLSFPGQLQRYAAADPVLFVDIETLGLSPKTSPIYLIGCGYFDNNGFNISQFFADSYQDEPYLLQDFLSFSSGFKTLMHFNGDKFDLPFIKGRCRIYGLEHDLDARGSIDIYKEIKPLKNILPLSSLRQKNIELFLGIDREDEYDGGELINVYRRYVKEKSDNDKRLLLLHNREDIAGMPHLLRILDYLALKDMTLSCISHDICSYTDHMGNIKRELIISYMHDLKLPKSFTSIKGNICIKCDMEGRIVFRVPVLDTEMKLFFEDHRNYYYLPDEKMCVHRSIAGSVDKMHRRPAKKEECFVNVRGSFIPYDNDPSVRLYRPGYASREYYISLEDLDINKYGEALLRRMNIH